MQLRCAVIAVNVPPSSRSPYPYPYDRVLAGTSMPLRKVGLRCASTLMISGEVCFFSHRSGSSQPPPPNSPAASRISTPLIAFVQTQKKGTRMRREAQLIRRTERTNGGARNANLPTGPRVSAPRALAPVAAAARPNSPNNPLGVRSPPLPPPLSQTRLGQPSSLSSFPPRAQHRLLVLPTAIVVAGSPEDFKKEAEGLRGVQYNKSELSYLTARCGGLCSASRTRAPVASISCG